MRVFDATLNVADPIDFGADPDRYVLAALRAAYEGRCYMGAFIRRVVAVLRRGPCRLMRSNPSGEGFVDVQFSAEVTVFGRWDILVGVTIAAQQQVVVGVYDGDGRAVVTLHAAKAETAAVGQKVAVRIVQANHSPGQEHAAVLGALLVCDGAAPVYRLADGATLEPGACAGLVPLLDQIGDELRRRAALPREDLWFFERLLYAYKARDGAPDEGDAALGAWAGPAGAAGAYAGPELVDLPELVRGVRDGAPRRVGGLWTRPLALHRSSPGVAHLRGAEAAAAPADWTPIDGTPREVFALLLKNILNFLRATRELVGCYPTREVRDAHANIWATMRAAQLARE